MQHLLPIFLLVPLAGFITSLFFRSRQEKPLSATAFATTGLQLLAATIFLPVWLVNGTPHLQQELLTLYHTDDYAFTLELQLDGITAVYLFVGSLLSFMVTVYSRYYLHREKGYKRFFNTILFFFLGYNCVILSGNLETLFMGWEMLGISSFLLIAFYRGRYLPVNNALKVFFIYRIGDVGLLLAMWMRHQVEDPALDHGLTGFFISFMILTAAAAKSAQLPFSSWLPRAMEGPTPSSAIFYGSLSVHIGAFLLLRTWPIWEQESAGRWLVGLTGLATTLVTSGIARVQSSVKSQIAYSSVAQIGLIFVEIAAGWHALALLHFAGNAFLRTYQLLISPSVVSYLIREQFYDYSSTSATVETRLPSRFARGLYILCLKEWNLDRLLYRLGWSPIEKAGKGLHVLNLKWVLIFAIPAYLTGLGLLFNINRLPAGWKFYLPLLSASIALVMVLLAFTERRKTWLSWALIIMNHFWIALAVAFNATGHLDHFLIYLSGIIISGLLGMACLKRLERFESFISLHRYHGHVYEHPRIALVFLLACLGLSGFPITPSFLGEDLVFHHINRHQYLLAAIVSTCFIIDGLAIIRIYARVFLGPHIKSYHEIAYKSS